MAGFGTNQLGLQVKQQLENIDEIHQLSKTSDERSLSAEERSVVAKQAAENTQLQLNEVAKGATNAETSQARVDDEGNTYETLQQRLNTKESQFNEQWAETSGKINPLSVDINEKDHGTPQVRIQSIEKNAKMIREDYPFLISAFSGNNGSQLDLYLSYDVKSFLPLNVTTLFEPKYGELRDPSIIFRNGIFYVCFTTPVSDGTGSGFGIAYSDDLLNWTEETIYLSTSFNGVYAPQWFVDDDGSVSIHLSLSDGSTEVDAFGNTIKFFRSFIMQATDETLLNFTDPVLINYSKTDNHIDHIVFKENGVYHIFVKNEHYRTIEHFTSTSLTGYYTFKQTLPFKRHVEGPAIAKKDGSYILLADEFTNGSSTCLYSTDLETWGNETKVKSLDGSRIQHFDIIQLDKDSLAIVESVMKRFLLESIGSRALYVKPKQSGYKLGICMNGTTFTPPDPDGRYSVDDSDTNKMFTITNITKPTDGKRHRITLILTTGNSNASITLKNGGGILTPHYRDFIISPDKGLTNVEIPLNFDGGSWRIENMPAEVLRIPTVIDLGSGTINNLVVKDNYVYRITGSNSVVINNFDVSQASIHSVIKFVKYTTELSPSITIKTGNGIRLPRGEDLVIDGADVIYTFERNMGDGNFRLQVS